MADTVDAIVGAATAEPIELPRLTVANVFINYGRLGAALGQAVEAYKALPSTAQQTSTDTLKEIVKQCEGAIKIASRLLEANR